MSYSITDNKVSSRLEDIEVSSIQIVAQLVGRPKKYHGDQGPWRSSIGRVSTSEPVALGFGGLEYDSVADTRFHGTPDQAVCCHSAAHYAFWNNEFALTSTSRELLPGAIGENWTLSNCDEHTICIGDTFTVGTATVQVSQPRTPCWKQEAKTGLNNLLARTTETLKTGFYMRVLEPGIVTAGDVLMLVNRPHPKVNIASLCDFKFHGKNPEFIRDAVRIDELSETWRASLTRKLQAY